MRGEEVFFLTGTDEHGAKIAQEAEKAGREPQDFVNSMAAEFKKAWQNLAITPDGFIRTTDPQHKTVVQAFLQQLFYAGLIYKGEYRGLYCVGCEEFKTETQIGENQTCPIHLTSLTEVQEEAYLFKLSAYKTELKTLIESDSIKIRPESRKNEVLSFLSRDELKDIAISRKNVPWGIVVPWDNDHTVYVWVDALLNYFSAAEEAGPAFDKGKKPVFPPTSQLIGKDILRFHAIIWPALLLAAKKPLPSDLFVHGYFTLNGHKISKSLGNIITPQELIDRYGVDASRYLLLSAIPFGADGDISLERLDGLYNSDLANNLGNLVNRVQAMVGKYRANQVPQVPTDREKWHLSNYNNLIEAYAFDAAIRGLQAQINVFNSYIEEQKPWQLAKEGKDADLDRVLATLSEGIFALGALFSPFMPESAANIMTLFGTSMDAISYDTLGTNTPTLGKTIVPIEPLFPRLDA